jgi:hypothetical protein
MCKLQEGKIVKIHCKIITSTELNVGKLQHETRYRFSSLTDTWATILWMRQEMVNVNINKQNHF